MKFNESLSGEKKEEVEQRTALSGVPPLEVHDLTVSYHR